MNRECWTEMDLYWFQGGDLQGKVGDLFDRLTPLWARNPEARKGLTLCAGWLFDSVLYWNGDLDDVIATCQAPTYEPWTYGRAAKLVRMLKDEAKARRLADFHVGLILLGGKTMAYNAEATCEGWSGRTEETKERAHYNIEGKWFYEHPEVDWDRYGVPYFGSVVNVAEGEAVCEEASPTFGRYFADKLCDLFQRTGFDAVVLRDGVFTRAYCRGNRARYMEPRLADELNQSFVDLFARMKRQMPELVIIGYDSGTSSMEEWRSHGFDLEKVAKSGHLDLWITQTWASAWQDYWPAHGMGYTFQLANVLVNLAMLADTPCNHMFLIETFDAWEPWDSVHQYPSKVAWEIWAYSHAAGFGSGGEPRRSDGCYVSWMNRGEALIPEETVRYLRATMEECASDLAKNPIPGGPCLVYHRPGLEHLLRHPDAVSRGEEMDDWVGMLLKYGVPALSIARSEWLETAPADAYAVPAPARMDEALSGLLLRRMSEGVPVMFMGQALQIPEELREEISLPVETTAARSGLPSAAVVEGGLARETGASGLQLNQRQRSMKRGDAWIPLIECLGGPVFAKHRELPCFVWETPEWGTPDELHLTAKSIGSPQAYHAVASAFGASGWGAEGLRWSNEDWQKPICFLFWRYEYGGTGVLLGNLETGTTGNSQFAAKGYLAREPRIGGSVEGMEHFGPGFVRETELGSYVAVGPHKACVLILKNS